MTADDGLRRPCRPVGTTCDMRGVQPGHHGPDGTAETVLRRCDLAGPVQSLTAPLFDAVHERVRHGVLTGRIAP